MMKIWAVILAIALMTQEGSFILSSYNYICCFNLIYSIVLLMKHHFVQDWLPNAINAPQQLTAQSVVTNIKGTLKMPAV
jgi:hypothetical protein